MKPRHNMCKDECKQGSLENLSQEVETGRNFKVIDATSDHETAFNHRSSKS